MKTSVIDRGTKRIFIIVAIMFATLMAGGAHAHAIGGDPADPNGQPFFALWNDEEKSIQFSAEEPSGGAMNRSPASKTLFKNTKMKS